MSDALHVTKNYSLFELHGFNRNAHKVTALVNSMEKHGYLPPYPLHVIRNGRGKLRIVAGQHRFIAARQIGIPVYYVVCEDDSVTIHELEKATTRWTLQDYLESYARCNKSAYITVRDFHKRTGIGLNACLGLLGGVGSALRGPFVDDFKDGSFEIKDITRSDTVASLVKATQEGRFSAATHGGFVNALSKIVFIPGIDISRLRANLKKYAALIEKQPSVHGYLEEIEEVYNRQRKDKLPLAFLAEEAARERQTACRFKKGNLKQQKR